VYCILHIVKGRLQTFRCLLSGLLLDLSLTRYFNLKDIMARITSQRAVEAIGGSRYDLVLAASQRARELRRGAMPLVDSENGPVVTALREIEQKKYTQLDYLKSIKK
jgi:DNA-directed RNA polymerase omega subunit